MMKLAKGTMSFRILCINAFRSICEGWSCLIRSLTASIGSLIPKQYWQLLKF